MLVFSGIELKNNLFADKIICFPSTNFKIGIYDL